MLTAVLIRKYEANGYVATVPTLPGFRGKGETRDAALQDLKSIIEESMAGVSEFEVTTIDIDISKLEQASLEKNPWLETAGMFADDPDLMPMLEQIYAARAAERPLE